MLSLKSLAMAMPRLLPSSLSKLPLSSTSPLSTSAPLAAANLQKQRSGAEAGSIWRLPQFTAQMVWPNYKPALIHPKHKRQQAWHTYGVQKQTTFNVVDNSALGRQAMAEGRPPKCIHVYSKKHNRKRHGAYGKLGDRVMVAIMGQKKKAIVVGLKTKQLANVPRFDSNNIVLIEESGNPSGSRITAPLPNCIRPGLQKASDPKKADYTKLFAIATRWV